MYYARIGSGGRWVGNNVGGYQHIVDMEDLVNVPISDDDGSEMQTDRRTPAGSSWSPIIRAVVVNVFSIIVLITILMYMTYNLPTPPISTLVFRSREPTPTILDSSGGTNKHIPVQNFTALADLASRWIEDNKLKVIASNWLSTETKVHAVESALSKHMVDASGFLSRSRLEQEKLVALSVARYPNLMKLMKENREVIEGLNIPGKDPTHLNVTEIIQMAEHLESEANPI